MNKVAFNDLRAWIVALEKEGHLARVTKKVHWDQEIGAVVRRTFDTYGDASPALLFENIAGYEPPKPGKVFAGLFRSYTRIAMMLGLVSPSLKRRDIIMFVRNCFNQRIPPIAVQSGPVKENILTGKGVDIFKFPVPYWHKRDGGRYIGTMHSVITKDYDSDWVNVGLYRIMCQGPDELSIYLTPGRQHIGQQYAKYLAAKERMPIAIAIGADPALSFVSAAAVPSGVCEYDLAGAIRGAPLETVKAETVDLPVPANAEIVIEGYVDPDLKKMEGPFGEYPGYYGDVPGMAPVIHITAITYRDDPILQGAMEGHPVGESHVLAAILKSATAWNVLEGNGVMGIKDVALIPEAASGHIVISITPAVQGHADWIASALWGMSNAVWSFKHVIVVDDDIDPWNPHQVNWAIAWRVKASQDIKIWKDHRGSPIDPRQEPERKGYWDRVLIDATRPFDWEPRAIWGSEGVNKGVPLNYPPTTRPDPELVKRINRNWADYGIKPAESFIGSPGGMMEHWWQEE